MGENYISTKDWAEPPHTHSEVKRHTDVNIEWMDKTRDEMSNCSYMQDATIAMIDFMFITYKRVMLQYG
jgi:hypothetical protein